MSEKKEGLKLYGAPWYITLIGCAIVIAATYLGALGKDFASIMILIIAYGVVFFEIGERLPIWNTYIGGGALAGLFFGISPVNVILRYVLPVMGGGNGAGAVPMSEIYEKVTGNSAVSYYAFAIIILTIANIMSIIAGALLNALGEKHPSLTGDKKTLLRKNTFNVEDAKEAEPTFSDMCGAIMVIFGSYALGQLFSGSILPTIAGAPIHEYAYMILFVVILSATGVIPKNIRAGAKRLQKFMNKACAVVMMAGLGFDFDLGELVAACTVSNVIIALFIVIGAIVGSALVGQLVGFYPIDSAITAGLCMANRGGNGDVAVLGAAKRMDLMAYAQLSSRLGGGIVLIVASFLFSFLK